MYNLFFHIKPYNYVFVKKSFIYLNEENNIL